MTRCLTLLPLLAAFAFASNAISGGGKGEQQEIRLNGNLANSEKDSIRNSPADVHVVPLKKGKTYIISLTGQGFNPYLRLEDAKGKQLDEDNNTGQNQNVLIRFSCQKDGDYRVVCSTFQMNPKIAKAAYTVSIKLAGEPISAHTPLLDKPAPDLQGDFALNGKPSKLSDFKGKVVLLYFWAVQSAESVSVLPQICELDKTYRDKGLQVVGVTYFNSELGHRLGFDPVQGKLTDIPKANVKTDKAMLAAFASHYKLEHLQLVMHKDKALASFNDYIVNGLPEVVLIDRKGIIRDVRGRADVEAQIVEMLAQQ